MQKKNKIYVHSQNPGAVGGIDLLKFPLADQEKMRRNYQLSEDPFETHRDEYFVFALLTKGHVDFIIDMEEVTISEMSLMIVKPYQVHSLKQYDEKSEGYFITSAPFLIPNECNDIFQNLQIKEQIFKLSDFEDQDIIETASLLHRSFTAALLNRQQIINGLFLSLVYRIVNLAADATAKPKQKVLQAGAITLKFQKLLTSYSILEPPSFFAEKLNITTSHLNDCVKKSTGYSVTYWLQDRIVMEAKRMLYYTNNDVKVIAGNLGFEDHTYFSRLFKKVSGDTPLSFRNKFRE
ncbi:hypothetical protein B4N84_02695 [Flavobacterium sp. IR1]|nr:hypothetical protein B4N84_02695 [Flavobacterium sp. IR1]